MTLTNTVAAKLTVAFVAIAMVFSLVAPAQAQTAEELQATIDALMAQINNLNSEMGMGSGDATSSGSSSSVCPYQWTRDLTLGASGDDVMKLQMFLMDKGESIPAGPTDYFGGQTQSALASMQAKNGISPAVGYFGPVTRAAVNPMCASAPVMDDDYMTDDDDDMMDDDDDMMDDDSSDSSLGGGEADVEDFDFSDEEDEAAEGEEDVPVLNTEFDVEDGDVRLERMDIVFDASAIGADGEDEPWEAFDEVSVWVDGDKVASEDVTDEDDWDELGSSQYEFRVTDIDSVFREDDTGEVIVAVSVAGGVDIDTDAGEDDWNVFVPEDGMRFVDGEGLDIEGPSTDGDASTFELQEEGEDDDLSLDSSDEDPEATTLPVDEDDETEHMIFAFELSAEDSDNDISLDNLFIDVMMGSTDTDYDTLNELIDDFRIEIDGESFDAESYPGSTGTAVVEFDIDGDFEIEADEVATVQFFADFNDVDNTFTSATITASIDADTGSIDAEGADDIDVIDGSDRDGEEHTVRLDGVVLSSEPTDGTDDGDADAITSGVSTDDDYGTFFLEFDITVFGDDVWVETNSFTQASTAALSGVTFDIENSAGVSQLVASGTASVNFDIDGADEDNGFFELEEGNTYSATLSIDSYNPDTSGAYQLQLVSVGFNTTEDTTADTTQAPDDLTEYESDSVQINS